MIIQLYSAHLQPRYGSFYSTTSDNEPSNRKILEAILAVSYRLDAQTLAIQAMEGHLRTLRREQMPNAANTFTANENPPMPHYPTLPIAPVYNYNPAANPPGAPSNAPPYMMPYNQEIDFFLRADPEAEQRI